MSSRVLVSSSGNTLWGAEANAFDAVSDALADGAMRATAAAAAISSMTDFIMMSMGK